MPALASSDAYVQRGTRGELTGGDRAHALARVQAVLLAVAHVVDEVRRARDHAQHHERARGLRGDERAADHAGRARRGEHEQVLAPLPRPAGAQQHDRAPGRRADRLNRCRSLRER